MAGKNEGLAQSISTPSARRAVLEGIAARALLLSLLWLGLAGAAPPALAVGAAAVTATLGLSFLLYSPARDWRLRPRALLLVPLFLWEAIIAGIDVALRAVRPGPPMDPAILHHRLRSREGPVPMALAFMLSALPGTLVTDWEGEWLRVYSIDKRQHPLEKIAGIERRLAWALASHAGARQGGGR